MALKRRRFKDDVFWLRWPLIMLGLSVCVAVGAWWSAANYRNSMQRDEFNALNQLDLLSGQVREIEEAERIIVDNIDRYNSMVDRGLLEEENRVALLDEIAGIRNRYNLYPITVEIDEQDRVLIPYRTEVDFPEEQVTLRSSEINLQLPLLHEGDLTRLLEQLLASGRLLVVDNCSMRYALESEETFLTLVQHQLASCNLVWYTFRREPYLEIGL